MSSPQGHDEGDGMVIEEGGDSVSNSNRAVILVYYFLLGTPMGGLLAGTVPGKKKLPWEMGFPWELFLLSITPRLRGM